MGEGWNMQKKLTVELWKKNPGILGDKQVYKLIAEAPLYGNTTDTYYDFVVNSGTISGLDPLSLYYMVITKTDDGLDADISGYIAHP